MNRRIVICLLSFVLCPLVMYAQQAVAEVTDTEALPADTNVVVVLDTIIMASEDSAESAIARKERKEIYQGTTVKLDILSPLLVSGLSHWTIQHYELAVNVRLANRFYPTLEVGYAGGQMQQGDSIFYNAHGGFFRAGADINPLKRNPGSPHALLIGVRVGTCFQPRKVDCWGEIVAGCQVEICKGEWRTAKGKRSMAFYMGWMGRFKILFTREAENLTAAEMGPIYIPGFGHRSNMGWGASYHLGWKF